MKYGLSEASIAQICTVLEAYYQIDLAILYGSRAKGNFREGSDIDLTLCGKSIDLTTLNRIADQMDDLLLPYKIDLSILDTIKNDALLDHIQRVGVVFYQKSHKK